MEQEKKPKHQAKPKTEAQIDEAIDESFPASDPPSYNASPKEREPER